MRILASILSLIAVGCFADVNIGDTEESVLSELGDVKFKTTLPNGKRLLAFDRGEIVTLDGKVVSVKLEPIDDYKKRKLSEWNGLQGRLQKNVKDAYEAYLKCFYIRRDSFTGEYCIDYPQKDLYTQTRFRKGGRIEATVDGNGKISINTFYAGYSWIFHDNFLLKVGDDFNFYTSPKSSVRPHRSTITVDDEAMVVELCSYDGTEVEDAVRKMSINPKAEVTVRLGAIDFKLTDFDKQSIVSVFGLSRFIKENSIDPEKRKLIDEKLKLLSTQVAGK